MQFLRNVWYVAAYSKEVGRDLLARKIIGQNVLIYRREDGQVTAMSNICPHRFAPLNKGKREGDTVYCPYHGLGFGPDGRCSHNPHGDIIPDNAHLQKFHVEERDGFVWVWLGENSPLPELIPDMSRFVDAEGMHTPRSYFLANYRYDILIDNLLDLSHANYLHEGSFSSGEPDDAKTEVSSEGHMVTVMRREWGAPKPPFVEALLGDVGKVDSTVRIEWFPSQVIRFHLGLKAAGAAEEEEWAHSAQFYHIGTPADESNTHYFLGATRYGAEDKKADAAVAKRQVTVIDQEDGPMLEAIDDIMDKGDFMEMRPLILPVDRGGMQVRRTMNRLLKAELQ